MFRTALILTASALVLAPAAHAEIVSVPGAAFTTADAQAAGAGPALVNGVLDADGMTALMAPVDFPKNGQRICKMTIVYVDGSNEDLGIQLFRKSAKTGVNATNAPTLMAGLESSGNVADTTRRSSTKNITSRKINEKDNFYYLQTSFINTNLDIIGVQFDVRSSCP